MPTEAEMLAYLYRRELEREANERNAAAAAKSHVIAQSKAEGWLGIPSPFVPRSSYFVGDHGVNEAVPGAFSSPVYGSPGLPPFDE